MKSEAVWVPRERSFKAEDDYFLSALQPSGTSKNFFPSAMIQTATSAFLK